MISLLTEHTRKCVKVEYLGRIECDFQKSRVTGPWDHKDTVSAKKILQKFHACVPLSVSVEDTWIGPRLLRFMLGHCMSQMEQINLKGWHEDPKS